MSREVQVNELSRDMCLYSNKCEKNCYALNCETTWAAERLLDRGWHKQNNASTGYTIEQYQRVLTKAADMKAAIDDLHYMSKNGIYSWTEFGKVLDALYKARDEYMKVQHDIVRETF